MAKHLTQFQELLKQSRSIYHNYMTLRTAIRSRIKRAKKGKLIDGGKVYTLKTITIDEFTVPTYKRTYVSSKPYTRKK